MSAVLVIGPSWVGDMVLAQSLFKLLKQQQPDTAIDVAAPDWTLPILERMPEVRRGIALPFRHRKLDLGARLRIGRELRDGRYSQAIVLTNSLKSAILPWAARIPQRTGFLGEFRYGLLNDIRPLDKQALPMTVQRFCALGLPHQAMLSGELPEPRLQASADNAAVVLARLKYSPPQAPVLGLCPGAEYGPAKRWPADKYAEVAQWALSQDWAVWLFGSDKDADITRQINRMSGGRCLDLGGRTALAEAIDLMAMTSAVVSNDSGLMHIAAALDKPLVAVYGSSDPHHTPPMSRRAGIAFLGLACSPCFQRTCPLGHLDCLNRLPAQSILDKLASMPGHETQDKPAAGRSGPNQNIPINTGTH